MSKAVLISIKPEWCEMIALGEKTIEVKKTRPKLETPFKVYIYCTKGKPLLSTAEKSCFIDSTYKKGGNLYGLYELANGKVIGEFVCDDIKAFDVPYPAYSDKMDKTILEKSCIRYYDLHRYAWHDCLYAWNISNLVIYDKPKDLTDFFVEGECYPPRCFECKYFDEGNGYNVEDDCLLPHHLNEEGNDVKPLKRPPQSWCYVEEIS